MRRTPPVVTLVALALTPALAGQEPAPTFQELIAEGVALHEAGKFDEAIARYKKALEIDSGHPAALYELAVTYFSTKQYDLCETTARQGLERAGPLQPALFTVAGSCLSAAGKSDKALDVFAEGLAKHPADPDLNFNIAITLFHGDKPLLAVPHLEKAIEARPTASSPYLALGEILAKENRAVEGTWLLLRFLSLEMNSQRTPAAAKTMFEVLTAGVSADGEGKVTIGLGRETGDDQFAPLETARSLAAGAMHGEEEQAKSVAARHVAALVTFMKTADELSQGEQGAKLTDTFVWKRAAAPIVSLQRQGVLECFGYVLAAWAKLDGAHEWLAQNGRKVMELESALTELRR